MKFFENEQIQVTFLHFERRGHGNSPLTNGCG
ncbi:unknown protein [Azorhizobium caulinodans ORS 571]|uniref:Uncharacterized protein n=1 Tax=Azorhizobium caulinodans (strain ATCC 43989 / DSM 5975 / JCM 20966 / LMG 6465 / NBRC 14845 / NCIMB 13405 / ORS 571) TaxID=438753 RepID=A8IFR9_AZOC5|nr:unknown protein [Azorhizobium caulinodans ORS 571]